MFPYLMYSALLFRVLASCRPYAAALAEHPCAVPLLLEAARRRSEPLRTPADDLQGRRLALAALASLASFGLWPAAEPSKDEGLQDSPTSNFLDSGLAVQLADEDAAIRAAAAQLLAALRPGQLRDMLLVARRLDDRLHLFPGFIQEKVLTYLFPFLGRMPDS